MDNSIIISKLASDLNTNEKIITNIINLVNDGCTIPFIARYRKEWTNSMSDDDLRIFDEKYHYYLKFYERIDTIITSIDKQGKLTDEIKTSLFDAKTLSELEDIYRPYKPKKLTRAVIAKNKGLEPLSQFILLQKDEDKLEETINSFVDPEKGVNNREEALEGAKDIIAELISDNATYRKRIRDNILRYYKIHSVKDKKGEDEFSRFSMYYDYSEPISKIAVHRVLALNRGEKLSILKITLEGDDEYNINFIARSIIKFDSKFSSLIKDAIIDSYKRLIFPSIENEIRSDLTLNAENASIEVFKANLKELLLEAPTKNKVVLGFDPGIRTGCKIGIVDELGKLLTTSVIKLANTSKENEKNEADKLNSLIKKYHVSLISLGNGTGGRESEKFLKELVLPVFPTLDYVITNEAGASVYSASLLGAQEFPELDVSVRSAISLARRVQDPLAELVKIDPKSIGVGQYQHDMNQTHLSEALGGVVENCVNEVGVDLNHASVSLLTYVSGINEGIAKNIVKYREENGEFITKKDLLKVSKLGNKSFEQAAGFFRITGHDPLDNTGIHPESYDVAKKIIDKPELLNSTEKEIPSLSRSLNVGEETLKDIIEELKKPGRDIRDLNKKAKLNNDVTDIKDLSVGMKLNGTVRNLTDFGAFIDIGVHQDGLVHISEITDHFIKHPLEVLNIGQIVDVIVIGVDLEKRRISLSIKKAK